MSRRWRLLILLLLCLCLPALAWGATAQASFDRDTVPYGQTVTLNVSVQDPDSPLAPDIRALRNDFDILGQSSNAGFTSYNGTAKIQLTFGFALRPKHTGRIVVPALSIGGAVTQPVVLEVTDADPGTLQGNGASGNKLFLEASVDGEHGYVGQQMQYVMRVYYALNLNGASLDDPHADGVIFQRLGKDIDYLTDRNGMHYHVVERRFAMVPQRAGKLTIPPVSFQAETLDPNDPDTFFAPTTHVDLATPPVTVEVRDIPPGQDKATWLPVRDLTLSAEGLPADNQVHVGEPLNLTMTLQATGAMYDSLPPLSLPTIDGASVYPDKPIDGTRSDAASLIGRRQQSFAIIPRQPGELVIPEITVHWWNVVTGKPEVARLPERRLHVLPAAGQPAASTSVAPPAALSETPAKPAAVAPASTPRWLLAAIAGAVLVLLALLAWAWRRRRAENAPEAIPSSRDARAAFLAAARDGDAAMQASTLLRWAQQERPAIETLAMLSAALDSPLQRDAIDRLQRQRFAAHAVPIPADELAAAFRDGFLWKDAARRPDQPSPVLPPLYPFDTNRD